MKWNRVVGVIAVHIKAIAQGKILYNHFGLADCLMHFLPGDLQHFFPCLFLVLKICTLVYAVGFNGPLVAESMSCASYTPKYHRLFVSPPFFFSKFAITCASVGRLVHL